VQTVKIEFEVGKPWRCTSCKRETFIQEVEYEVDPDDPNDTEVPDTIGYPAYYDPFRRIAVCDACDPGPEGPE
jgi:hypothetical protein